MGGAVGGVVKVRKGGLRALQLFTSVHFGGVHTFQLVR